MTSLCPHILCIFSHTRWGDSLLPFKVYGKPVFCALGPSRKPLDPVKSSQYPSVRYPHPTHFLLILSQLPKWLAFKPQTWEETGLGSSVALDKLLWMILSLSFLPCEMVGAMAVPSLIALGMRWTPMSHAPRQHPLLLEALVSRQSKTHWDNCTACEGCPFLWFVSCPLEVHTLWSWRSLPRCRVPLQPSFPGQIAWRWVAGQRLECSPSPPWLVHPHIMASAAPSFQFFHMLSSGILGMRTAYKVLDQCAPAWGLPWCQSVEVVFNYVECLCCAKHFISSYLIFTIALLGYLSYLQIKKLT